MYDIPILTELQRRNTSWRQEQFEEAWESLTICTGLLVSCNYSMFGSKISNFIPEDMVLDTELQIYDFFTTSHLKGEIGYEN